MKWANFTRPRIDAFECAPGKQQSIFWDGKTPGLGLRVTAAGAKSFIFETSLRDKTIRITIGDAATWSIVRAQAEATAYKALTDNGIDPRQVEADRIAAESAATKEKAAAQAAAQARELREAVTLGEAWPKYIADRLNASEKGWSTLHHRDHLRIIQAGGIARKRSEKLTEPGPLASLADVRLVDLTSERIEAWAKVEAKRRPTRARLALRLLKAFLFWCASHTDYSGLNGPNPAQSKKARESLGKTRVKHDVLQKEQLPAWFEAVRRISSPVVSAYLQCLLLTGARREELARLRWDDVDFRWNSLKLNDKVEDFRMVPLTPYVSKLLVELKRQNETPPPDRRLRSLAARGETWAPSEWAFRSVTSASGRLTDPSVAHRAACKIAGLDISLHGLRRSFATLCEWTETPAGIAAQIQGHAPQGVREQNYIRRPLDLLRMWHVKIEVWMLKEACIEFVPEAPGLKIVTAA